MDIRTADPIHENESNDRHDRGRLGVLAAGHFVVDFSVGMLSPMLPAFKRALHLSDLRTSLILAAVTFSSSFIQPLFGLIADRVTATWFLWAGVGAAMLGMGFAGLASSYWLLLALIVIGGLGVGAYHPEAARLANHFAGTRKASGVAWFTVGGNFGFALGPLLVALLITRYDERTTLIVLVPGIVALGVLLANAGRMHVAVPHARARLDTRSDVRGMAVLVTAVSLRTWAQFGLMAIVPLYLTAERGMSGRGQGLVIFAFVMTGFCPVTAFSSSTAVSRIFELAIASPMPILTTTFSIFGIAIGFSMPNSLASAGAISLLYFSFNLAILFSLFGCPAPAAADFPDFSTDRSGQRARAACCQNLKIR